MKAINEFLHCVWFFTRIPVGSIVNIDGKTLVSSRVFLPLVGFVIGILASLVFLLMSYFFPTSVALLLTMIAMILLTGAFHEDAFADSVDGFGGGDTPGKIIKIMKDSRIGTYGTVALVFALALKFNLLLHTPFAILPKIILFAQIASRFAPLPLMSAIPYVRHDSLFEKNFETHRYTIAWKNLLLPFLFTQGAGFLLFGTVSFLIMLAVFTMTLINGWYYTKRLGGATGDCFGATVLLSELLIYFFGFFVL